MKASDSFLCLSCRRLMCVDCKTIADEYQELHLRRGAELRYAQEARIKAEQELERQRKRADDLDRILKIGIGPLMEAWVNSMPPSQLLSLLEKKP